MNLKRQTLIQILGGYRCKNCPVTDPRILEVDHIWGNGKEMPLSKTWVLDFYLDNPYLAKGDLQILCCNCHRIKSLENGDIGRRRAPDMGIVVKAKDIPRNILENMDWYR